MESLHYQSCAIGWTFASREPGGDPIAAYWDCGDHYKYRVDTLSPPLTGAVNKPAVSARGCDPELEVRTLLESFASVEQG